MLRILLIDDEPESLQVIASVVKMVAPDLEVVGAYTDPFEGLEALKKSPPDVLLLDIEMPGLTGLELLKRLETVSFEVIFITAYHQYALDAIKLSAIDYILKPVDPDELSNALEKAKERTKNRHLNDRLEVLEKLLVDKENNSKSQEKRIALSTMEGIHFVRMNQISRIEGAQNCCTFHFREGKSMLITKNLKVFETIFDDYDLMRVHRSHIINLYCVKRYIRTDGGYVEMENGEKMPVSGSKREALLSRLEGL